MYVYMYIHVSTRWRFKGQTQKSKSIMSVQWYGVAGLLYVELTVTVLLLIPFLRPAT